MKSTLWHLPLSILFIMVIIGCSNNQNDAPAAIERYIQALIAKDENLLINHSCAAWEIEAKNEFNSFSAVSVSLEDLSCQETGQDGEYTLVSCNGKIIANYGNEILEINLADQNYLAIYDGGEWRMCGYR